MSLRNYTLMARDVLLYFFGNFKFREQAEDIDLPLIVDLELSLYDAAHSGPDSV
jgi:hypothetical protein